VTLASGFAEDSDALPIRADARVLGATIKAGESVTHSVGDGRHAYLVPAVGKITIDGQTFNARDGAALSGGQTVTITAIDDAEIVLVDSD
jgi:redox-sensitive bicupin YhaK (pirin superfamily)